MIKSEEAITIIKDMKVDIPIPKAAATQIKRNAALGMAIKALEQYPILDKIRAEIEELIEWHDCPEELDGGNDLWFCEACKRAIEIIEKYKAESEDKEE